MRKNERWFEFKGKLFDRFSGVKLMDADIYPVATLRGTALQAAGRDGDLFQSDESYNTITLKRTIQFDSRRIDDIAGVLWGSGSLRFSAWPDRTFDARVDKFEPIKAVTPGEYPLMSATVTFLCQPFKRLYPPVIPDPTERQGIGDTIITQGNAVALPLIKIFITTLPITAAETVDFFMSIGNSVMEFRGVPVDIGEMYVDSELMDVYRFDDDGLPVSMNNYATGQPFWLDPAINNEVYVECNTDDVIVTINITPRWRWR